MKVGALLGRGRTADVYCISERQVAKIFHPEFFESAKFEFDLARKLEATGLPVPRVFDLVLQDERWSIVYERIDGPSMLAHIRSNPQSVAEMGQLLAELQSAIHETSLDGLPNGAQGLRRRIEWVDDLSQDTKARILEHLERLSPGLALCHGDLHPDNILLSRRGPVVIDWMTASAGNPLADVARTSLLIKYGAPPPTPELESTLLPIRTAFFDSYSYHYRRLRDASEDELDAWLLPVAAARLAERIPGEDTQLLALIESRLRQDPPDSDSSSA